jgi:P pilus assembly chaperone PapD
MRLWLGLAWAAAFLVTARPALPSINARAIPSRTSVMVKPGEPVSRDVMIANDGDNPVVVHVRLSDWSLDTSGELSLLPAGTTATSLQGLIAFEPAEFSLGAGESGVIHVTMRLPAEGPATRWGVLLSEVRPAAWPRTGLGSRAIAELGTTLYLTRVRPEQAHGELTGMNVRTVGDTALQVALTMKNPSPRHFYAAGKIAVRDSSGRVVADVDLGTSVVLPGMERVFTWTCDVRLATGRYAVTATLDTGEPELIVGETEVQWPLRKPARFIAGDGSP